MMAQTYYWIGLNIIAAAGMFALVPVKRIKQLFWFGLIGGIGLSGVIFVANNLIHLWTTIGGIKLFGLYPLLPGIAWFFPEVIFANYFPKNHSLFTKVVYVLLFAAGSMAAQYVFDLLGMWRNIHWNLFYTFLLATATHTILSLYMEFTKQYLPE